ncbi:MAG: hypothetical protein ABI835_02815 [Chloroflexota bacterium]
MRKLDETVLIRVSKRDLEVLDALGAKMLQSEKLTEDQKRELKTLDGKISRAAVIRLSFRRIAKNSGVKLYELGKGFMPYTDESP